MGIYQTAAEHSAAVLRGSEENYRFAYKRRRR